MKELRFFRPGYWKHLEPVTIPLYEENMDAKIKKAEKKIDKVEKKEFKGLLKEDHKLDAKRDKLEKEVKMDKKGKKC